jgi:hypothetical protein
MERSSEIMRSFIFSNTPILQYSNTPITNLRIRVDTIHR